jgi:hypothetical protein
MWQEHEATLGPGQLDDPHVDTLASGRAGGILVGVALIAEGQWDRSPGGFLHRSGHDAYLGTVLGIGSSGAWLSAG